MDSVDSSPKSMHQFACYNQDYTTTAPAAAAATSNATTNTISLSVVYFGPRS